MAIKGKLPEYFGNIIGINKIDPIRTKAETAAYIHVMSLAFFLKIDSLSDIDLSDNTLKIVTEFDALNAIPTIVIVPIIFNAKLNNPTSKVE